MVCSLSVRRACFTSFWAKECLQLNVWAGGGPVDVFLETTAAGGATGVADVVGVTVYSANRSQSVVLRVLQLS